MPKQKLPPKEPPKKKGKIVFAASMLLAKNSVAKEAVLEAVEKEFGSKPTSPSFWSLHVRGHLKHKCDAELVELENGNWTARKLLAASSKPTAKKKKSTKKTPAKKSAKK